MSFSVFSVKGHHYLPGVNQEKLHLIMINYYWFIPSKQWSSQYGGCIRFGPMIYIIAEHWNQPACKWHSLGKSVNSLRAGCWWFLPFNWTQFKLCTETPQKEVQVKSQKSCWKSSDYNANLIAFKYWIWKSQVYFVSKTCNLNQNQRETAAAVDLTWSLKQPSV